MKALIASPACAEALALVEQSDEDYTLVLPAGCQEFGTVTVKVDTD
jgi:hypothetical protein